MPEIYDPLNLIELEPIALGAAQEERAAKKKGGGQHAPPKEPKEPKRGSLPAALEAPAAPPEPIPPSPEQLRLMLDKISAYRERFAHLKSRNKKLSTPEEIEDELHYLELQLGSSQGVNFGASGLVVRIVCVSRKITSPYPFGSIKQFKIRRWGRCCESTSRKI